MRTGGWRVLAPFRFREYRLLITAVSFSIFATGMWAVVMALQVMAIDDDPASLSLVAACMGVGMVAFLLVGGHRRGPLPAAHDHHSRRDGELRRRDGRRDSRRGRFVAAVAHGRRRRLPWRRRGVLLPGLQRIPAAHPARRTVVGGQRNRGRGPPDAAAGDRARHRRRACRRDLPDAGRRHRCGAVRHRAGAAGRDATACRSRSWTTAARRRTCWPTCRTVSCSCCAPGGCWPRCCSPVCFVLLVIGPIEVLLPFITKARFENGERTYGFVLAAYGIGGALGALAVSSGRLPRRYMTVMMLCWGLGNLPLVVLGYYVVVPVDGRRRIRRRAHRQRGHGHLGHVVAAASAAGDAGPGVEPGLLRVIGVHAGVDGRRRPAVQGRFRSRRSSWRPA